MILLQPLYSLLSLTATSTTLNGPSSSRLDHLIASGVVDDVYVPPVANDAGTSLGAAQVLALAHGFKAALSAHRVAQQASRDARSLVEE
jgi:hypothetical protein